MSEDDLLYSIVNFTRGNAQLERDRKAGEREKVACSKGTWDGFKIPAPNNKPDPTGRCTVTSGRAALLVLGALLAASVVAFGLIFYEIIQTKERLQRMTDERDAVVKNLTAVIQRRCEVKPYKPCETCPEPPEGNIANSCEKCEEGWNSHGGNCYYFSTIKLNWKESRRQCQHQGGDLVKIDSNKEQEFLKLELSKKIVEDEDKFWIGLTDSKEEKKWLWPDNSPLSLSFWSANEPDNWMGHNPEGEDCVRMGERASSADLKSWFDNSCKVPHKRICEKPEQSGHLKCV
ncbi:immune-related, lectin-like receptor 4 [Cottoperca gobio]|uniref:Immune-related, lectin-like receptor 4 n=1 Tax=Cottoperca gobio TaxID=56716 RepID=A0A6J2QMR1_COTGO|nr:C-type lectin domain family 4 member E-like [Cottoperca gobio]